MFDTTTAILSGGESARPRVWSPGEPGYTAADPWNRAVVSRPAAVIEASTPADVAWAVRYAGDHGLRVAVRSSGHGAVPLGPSTVLVHTASMDGFRIDPTRRRALISAGTSWRQVLHAAGPFGLAPICGSAPGIGAVGFLTGGGIGPVARTYGVSSDRVRAIQVVTGDGRILRTTPEEHEDLFWGLRGGKATLGIVAAIDLELPKMPQFYGGAIWFDAADTGRVLQSWLGLCDELPEHGTTSAAIIRLPAVDAIPAPIAGRQTVAVRFAWTGHPADGDRYLDAIRGSAHAVLDDVRIRPYTEIGDVHCDPVAPSVETQQSMLLADLSSDAIDVLLGTVGQQDNRQNIVELRQLGGAIAREPRHASAVSHRDASFSLLVAGSAANEADAVAGHAASVVQAMSPWSSGGLLPNFAASDDPAVIRRCYDRDSLHWLVSLGDQYDPQHVLDVGQVARSAQRSS
jgi:FAD/FMN-containing dehydrogenase